MCEIKLENRNIIMHLYYLSFDPLNLGYSLSIECSRPYYLENARPNASHFTCPRHAVLFSYFSQARTCRRRSSVQPVQFSGSKKLLPTTAYQL